jgi:hypothetical protein
VGLRLLLRVVSPNVTLRLVKYRWLWLWHFPQSTQSREESYDVKTSMGRTQGSFRIARPGEKSCFVQAVTSDRKETRRDDVTVCHRIYTQGRTTGRNRYTRRIAVGNVAGIFAGRILAIESRDDIPSFENLKLKLVEEEARQIDRVIPPIPISFLKAVA